MDTANSTQLWAQDYMYAALLGTCGAFLNALIILVGIRLFSN